MKDRQMEFDITVKFSGDEAERHRIPAYEGAQSLQGISRGLVLVSNYLTTGEIRKRAPFSQDVKFYLQPSRPGSFEIILTTVIENIDLIAVGGIVSTIGFAITANLLTDGFKTIFGRIIGGGQTPETDEFQMIDDARPGDVDALVDAAEPAIIQAHTIINQGSSNIVVIQGDNNILTLNSTSKEYVKRSRFGEDIERLDVSVGSLNVNTGYGRVFVHDLGKTVPFTVVKEPDAGTYGALSHSLNQYANGKQGCSTLST